MKKVYLPTILVLIFTLALGSHNVIVATQATSGKSFLPLVTKPSVIPQKDNLLWNTFIGADSHSFFLPHQDGGLVIGGVYRHNQMVYIKHINTNGAENWNTEFVVNRSTTGTPGPSIASAFISSDNFIYLFGTATPDRVNRPSADSDVFIAKLNLFGDLLWVKFYGSELSTDSAIQMFTTTNSDIYISGYSYTSWGKPINAFITDPNIPYKNFFFAKLDNEGNLLWNTFYDEKFFADQISGIVNTKKEIVFTGQSTKSWGSPLREFTGESDVFVAKFSSEGQLIWNTFLGSKEDNTFPPKKDGVHGLVLANDGGFFVEGYSPQNWGTPRKPRFDSNWYVTFIARLDSEGNLLWNTFPIEANRVGRLAYKTVQDDLILVGDDTGNWGNPIHPTSGNLDCYVALINNQGDIIWNTFLGGADIDTSCSLASASDGGYIAVGISLKTWGDPIRSITPPAASTSTASMDTFIAKLDAQGQLKWNTFIGGNLEDYPSVVFATAGNNIFLSGGSEATWGLPIKSYTKGAPIYIAKLTDLPN